MVCVRMCVMRAEANGELGHVHVKGKRTIALIFTMLVGRFWK